MKLRWQAILAAVLGLVLAGTAMAVVPGGTDQDRSADQKLLKQLNARSTDEVDRELFAPDDPKAKPADRPQANTDHLPKPGDSRQDPGERLLRQIERSGIAEKGNPLIGIARQMRKAETLIGQADCGPETQKLQEQILADLEELLKQTKKNCEGQGECKPGDKPGECKPGECKPGECKQGKKPGECKGVPKPGKGLGGQARPGGNPARNPNPQPGKMVSPPPKPSSQPFGSGANTPDPKELSAAQSTVWGDLPAHQREQMSQALSDEQFLPKYEMLIGDYFRRLAEQKENGGR
jgi:hypothetical protein